MRFATVVSLLRSGRLPAMYAVGRAASGFYRVAFLVAAARSGLLAHLSAGPASLEEIGAALGVPDDGRTALEAWLRVGAALGEIGAGDGRWRLTGRLARTFASPGADDLVATFEETLDLHRRLLVETPSLLRTGRRWTLADQDGTLVARSSRILEPLVHEAVAAVVPADGALRVLEIGCGSGTYARFCAERNPQVSVVGLELQPDVAEQARRNLRSWGVAGRVTVETADVRAYATAEPFDVVTMHNNVYYFAEAEQTGVLAGVLGLLRPGGRLLLTTACHGGSPAVEVLSLWGAVTAGCTPLPDPGTLLARLQAAGFVEVEARNLAWPVDAFYAFVGRRPLAGSGRTPADAPAGDRR